MDGSIGSMSSTMEWGAYLGVFLVVLELAKRIASLTPGKADDEIVSNIERIVRIEDSLLTLSMDQIKSHTSDTIWKEFIRFAARKI